MSIPVHGYCQPQFHAVRQAFERNFNEFGEVGARVAVIQAGHTVVDLWGGYTTV